MTDIEQNEILHNIILKDLIWYWKEYYSGDVLQLKDAASERLVHWRSECRQKFPAYISAFNEIEKFWSGLKFDKGLICRLTYWRLSSYLIHLEETKGKYPALKYFRDVLEKIGIDSDYSKDWYAHRFRHRNKINKIQNFELSKSDQDKLKRMGLLILEDFPLEYPTSLNT